MYNFKNVFESWQSQDLSILGVSNELEVISWDVALGENAVVGRNHSTGSQEGGFM